jgi:hypothetical protein
LESGEKIRAFLKDHALFAAQFLGLTSQREENILVERLDAVVHNANIQALYQKVRRVFGDFSAMQQQFERAFRYLLYDYPDFKILLSRR